jgi:osmotically-inducible protein OsmY
MRAPVIASLVALAVLMLGMGTASAQSAVEDAATKARLETTFLLNPHLSAFSINTRVQEGHVWLAGSVDNEVQRDLAQELAEQTTGVRRVTNELVVVDEPRRGGGDRSWQQRIQDTTTSASVRTRLLGHREIRGLSIGVRTQNGVVTLTGIAFSEEQRNRIVQVASETQGVERVVSNLTLAERRQADGVLERVTGTVSDEVTEKQVQTRIVFNRHVRVRDLEVDVIDGECILTGLVESEAMRQIAGNIALNTSGVQSVRNEITVADPPLDAEILEPGH